MEFGSRLQTGYAGGYRPNIARWFAGWSAVGAKSGFWEF